jgi:hypothetical protein
MLEKQKVELKNQTTSLGFGWGSGRLIGPVKVLMGESKSIIWPNHWSGL